MPPKMSSSCTAMAPWPGCMLPWAPPAHAARPAAAIAAASAAGAATAATRRAAPGNPRAAEVACLGEHNSAEKTFLPLNESRLWQSPTAELRSCGQGGGKTQSTISWSAGRRLDCPSRPQQSKLCCWARHAHSTMHGAALPTCTSQRSACSGSPSGPREQSCRRGHNTGRNVKAKTSAPAQG